MVAAARVCCTWAPAGAVAFVLLAAPGRLDDVTFRQEVPAPPVVEQPSAAPDEASILASRLAGELARRMPRLDAEEAEQISSTILHESEQARLDPVLVFAMIEVESRWDPDAVSERGARGLMQLRRLALESEAQAAGFSADDPHDPVVNVRAGIRYYRRMVRAFRDADLALVAYNVGPTRLSSYLNAVGEVPDELWGYARRVRREEQRLRRALDLPARELLARR